MKVDPNPQPTEPEVKMVDTSGCGCNGCACGRNAAADMGKTPDAVSDGKRYIQQAEFEKDIAAFADKLPLFTENGVSPEGVTREQAKPVGEPKARTTIYGIPKNGTIVAHHVVKYLQSQGKDVQITYNPDHANFIVDDLIDSGRTAAKYEKRWSVPVYAMYVKKEVRPEIAEKSVSNLTGQWIVFPWEADVLSEQTESDAVTRLIEMIGEDPNRNGLLETPQRYIKAFKEMTRGYTMKPNLTMFEKDGFDQIVLLKDIPFHSLCEHHLLPFFGKMHIAYVPNKKIIGLSKLARVADKYACRLQNQERIGEQIVTELIEALDPLGVAVIIEGVHHCAQGRGVLKEGMKMVTSKLTGVFRDSDNQARTELLHLLK